MTGDSPIQNARFIVKGRVQGVGYRYYTRRLAMKLGVSGAARNLPDGTVEVIGRGSSEDLESFYQGLLRGPDASRVETVETRPVDPLEPSFNQYDLVF
ncbi:acylphosphatase [bacterium]|nr:acylphosphatase [candidate division CSSED10-310 bacterium]